MCVTNSFLSWLRVRLTTQCAARSFLKKAVLEQQEAENRSFPLHCKVCKLLFASCSLQVALCKLLFAVSRCPSEFLQEVVILTNLKISFWQNLFHSFKKRLLIMDRRHPFLPRRQICFSLLPSSCFLELLLRAVRFQRLFKCENDVYTHRSSH